MKISPIPKIARFAEDEIEVLNRVVGPASATQRAWLAAHAAAPPQAAVPLTSRSRAWRTPAVSR